MDGFGYFLRLAGQALEVTRVFPPTAVLGLASLAGALGEASRVPPGLRRRAVAGAVIPLAIPAAILLCGALLVYDTDLDVPAAWWSE
jgi:hypothetical protein